MEDDAFVELDDDELICSHLGGLISFFGVLAILYIHCALVLILVFCGGFLSGVAFFVRFDRR